MFDETGNCFIFAGCHQMTSHVIYQGQRDVVESCQKALDGGFTCVNIGKGFTEKVVSVLHRSASILNYLPVYPAYSKKNPYLPIVSSTVEEALIRGADGLVVPVDFYDEELAPAAMKMVTDYVRECDKYGLVFTVEAEYPTFYSTNDDNVKKYGAEYLMFAGRICAEMGVDVISTNYTNDPESFKAIIDYVKLPVLINGGTKVPESDFLKIVDITAKAGARGCLIGRNVSEAKDPTKMARAIVEIFRNGISADEACKILR
jgi:fructose-bisphosphate aldolase/2-amino-3,7-dideoxy-D-threo-hept-6-ulosonate synthase